MVRKFIKSIIKNIRLIIRIGTMFFFNQKAALKINSALCPQFLTGKVAEEIYRPSLIAKGGLEMLLSVEFKISDQKRKYLERMREIVELNYIQIDVESFELGDKMQLGLFLSSADNERRPNHDDDDDDDDHNKYDDDDDDDDDDGDYDDDTKDDDDYTDDVICID